MDETTQAGFVIPGAEAVQSMSVDELKALVRELTTHHGITGRFIAQAAGYSPAALTTWMKGKYGKGTDVTFENTLRSALEKILSQRFFAGNETARKFARMRTSVADAVFCAAASCQKRGLIGLVTGPGGRGKTTAAEMYAASHADVVYIATSPLMTTVSSLIREIAAALDVQSRSTFGLQKGICDKLQHRKALIMVDEAENIPLDFLDALRVLNDQAGIGILFIGQDRFFTMLAKSRKQHEYLVDRFRLRTRVSDLGISDVQLLAGSEISVTGIETALLRACGGSARFLETLVFHLRDIETVGDALTDKVVAETAEAVRIF